MRECELLVVREVDSPWLVLTALYWDLEHSTATHRVCITHRARPLHSGKLGGSDILCQKIQTDIESCLLS